MLRQQVNAKVIWGARDREVLDWLQERHGITDSSANDLLVEAHRAKRAAVRRKALLYLVLSIPGMLIPLACFVLQGMGRFVVIGYGAVLLFFRLHQPRRLFSQPVPVAYRPHPRLRRLST
jgi:hypothetical protein